MVWIFRSGGQTTCIAKIMHKHTHEDSKNKGGGGQHTCPPDHDLPNTAVRRNFVGGGGKFFNNNVEHCKQILRTKIERFGAYLGYFFHLNDYETKIHYFKNFGGGGTRAPAPPPPCVRPCCPKKSCTLHFISPAPHTITHLVDPHGHNTESTRESYNASLINAINVHSCINC